MSENKVSMGEKSPVFVIIASCALNSGLKHVKP